MSALKCKCVGCGHVETFVPIPSDVPMCPKCFAPMVAVEAIIRRERRPARAAAVQPPEEQR